MSDISTSEAGMLPLSGQGPQAGEAATERGEGSTGEHGQAIIKPATVPGRRGGTLTPVRTTEASRALNEKRWGKAERIARQALSELGEIGKWEAGWLMTVKAQAELGASGKRGSTPAAAFVGRAAAILRPGRTGSDDGPASGATLHMSEGVALRLAELLAGKRGE